MSSHPAVYLLLGPETGQKQEFLDTVRAAIQRLTGEQPEEHRFYPYKAEIRDLVSLLRNSSLFARHKLVTFSDAHELTRKPEVDPLVEYLKHPSSEATIVLMSDGYSVDRRIEKQIPGEQRKVFWELYENQKRAWLQRYFRERDISLDPDAAELILEMVDNDTQDLRRECDRLAQYVGPGSVVDEASIEQLIYHSKEENVFTLFDQIAERNLESVLVVLQTILLSGESEPVQLLGGLLWQFRKLLTLARLQEQRYNFEDACKRAGIRGKKSQRTYAAASRNYSVLDVERIIALTARYEGMLRSVKQDVQRLLIQLFMFRTVARKGQLPPRTVGLLPEHCIAKAY